MAFDGGNSDGVDATPPRKVGGEEPGKIKEEVQPTMGRAIYYYGE